MVDLREAVSRKRAVFRLDASASVGGGHAMRCLVLARALAAMGWSVAFAVNAEAAATVPALTAFPLVPGDGLAALAPIDLLVIDHYGLDAAYEAACRPLARTILAVDDLRRAHESDLVLDQNLGSRPEDYAGRVPGHCQVLAGPDYSLLRPTFPAARARALARRDGCLRRVLVCFGMADAANLTARALDGLAQAGLDLAVDVAVGPVAPWLVDWRDRPDCTLHVGADETTMAALLTDADILVGAAGSTVWEACCLGLPQLLAVSADNQRPGARALVAAGAAEVLCWQADLTARAVADAARRLAANPAQTEAMGRSAAAVCDGLGSERVVQRCLSPSS